MRPGRPPLAANARAGGMSTRSLCFGGGRFTEPFSVFPETRTTGLACYAVRVPGDCFSWPAQTAPGYGGERPGNDVGGRSIRASGAGGGSGFVGLEPKRRDAARATRPAGPDHVRREPPEAGPRLGRPARNVPASDEPGSGKSGSDEPGSDEPGSQKPVPHRPEPHRPEPRKAESDDAEPRKALSGRPAAGRPTAAPRVRRRPGAPTPGALTPAALTPAALTPGAPAPGGPTPGTSSPARRGAAGGGSLAAVRATSARVARTVAARLGRPAVASSVEPVPAVGLGPRRWPGGLSRLSWPLALVGVALVVASGFQLAAPMIRSAEAPHGRALPPPSPAPTTSPAGPAAATAIPPPPPPVVTDPVRLRIPAIALDAPVIGLGLDPQGAVDVPTQWGDVGWYKPGVAPGAVGPAVLVGHYDSKTGPAVFYRLGSVLPGDQLVVVGASGASVTFVVDRLQEVSKATFPAQEVYGPVTRPEIRLITCDGAFDEHTHHYVDNLVVYGHAISVPVAGSPAPSVVPAPLASVPVSALPAPAVPSATAPARSDAVPAPPAVAPTGTPAASLGSVIPLPLAPPPAAIPAATLGSGPPPAPRSTPATAG